MTETAAIATIRKPPAEALRQLERVVLEGNLATLQEGERVAYYARVCESLGLNPLTRPFEYITLNGKLTLYARKDATDQLRDLHGVSIGAIERDRDEALGTYIVTASASDRYGRVDSAIGVVSIAGLKGENLANAMMKAETKAKRRVTLSICGLGWMDEIEALDARSVEVAPRQAAASAIASRTAALLGGSGESDAVVPRGKATAAASGETTAAGSPPPDDEVGPFQAALNASQPRKRSRKALQPGEEGYGTARAHAVAAERGLDHDAVHRIAADVVTASSTTPVGDDFSVKNLDEETWAEVIAAINEAPATGTGLDAELFAGRMALQAGLGENDNPWSEAEPAVAEMFGVDKADELTPAQWVEFGIRIAARNPLP